MKCERSFKCIKRIDKTCFIYILYYSGSKTPKASSSLRVDQLAFIETESELACLKQGPCRVPLAHGSALSQPKGGSCWKPGVNIKLYGGQCGQQALALALLLFGWMVSHFVRQWHWLAQKLERGKYQLLDAFPEISGKADLLPSRHCL